MGNVKSLTKRDDIFVVYYSALCDFVCCGLSLIQFFFYLEYLDPSNAFANRWYSIIIPDLLLFWGKECFLLVFWNRICFVVLHWHQVKKCNPCLEDWDLFIKIYIFILYFFHCWLYWVNNRQTGIMRSKFMWATMGVCTGLLIPVTEHASVWRVCLNSFLPEHVNANLTVFKKWEDSGP